MHTNHTSYPLLCGMLPGMTRKSRTRNVHQRPTYHNVWFSFPFMSCFFDKLGGFLVAFRGRGVSARTGRIVHVRFFLLWGEMTPSRQKKNKQTNTLWPGHLLKGVAYWKNNSFQMISYQFQLRSVFVAFDDGCILWPARAINYDDAIIIVKKKRRKRKQTSLFIFWWSLFLMVLDVIFGGTLGDWSISHQAGWNRFYAKRN